MVLNVKDYGAKGDGVTLDTRAILDAINACNNGVVYFPAGRYLTGTIFLKSGVTLYLSKQAVILGSTDLADYEGDYTGCIEAPTFNKCLLFAEGQTGIEITGGGEIYGQGDHFPQEDENQERGERPMLMRFVNCSDIKLHDIKIGGSGSWCCHMIDCSQVNIRGVNLYNHVNQNNDGFDLDDCSDVFISDTKIDSIDDSICLKSTTSQPCRNIAVTNCVISSETAAVKFGTSSKAGFTDITISNCVFHDCLMGTIKLLMVDGGILENINISNIMMNRVGSPLFIRLGQRGLNYDKPAEMDFWGKGKENEEAPGRIRNIMISNIQANVTLPEKERTPMMLTGLPGYNIENITLNNFSVTYPGGGTAEDAARQVDEDPARYPEQWFFGILPAYGLYLRHAENVKLRDVYFYLADKDERPAMVCEDVQTLSIDGGNIKKGCVTELLKDKRTTA